jgi:hypothetical protein
LKNGNPLGIWRMIEGTMTRGTVTAPSTQT